MFMPIQIRIRIGIKAMLILTRILPQVLIMLENWIFFTFSHSITSLKCFIFLISVKYIIIFNILDSMLKYSVKKFVY